MKGQQILFYTIYDNDNIYAGILLPDGNVICADDGTWLTEKEIIIYKLYGYWIDLSEKIAGDDSDLLTI